MDWSSLGEKVKLLGKRRLRPTSIKSFSMLIDRHEHEDVFVRVPELVGQALY